MKKKSISKSILVVEDNPLVSSMIKFILEAEGFSVCTAGDGEEALNVLSENDFDLVISDIMMPNVDGFTFIKALKKISNIPVIILTALTGSKDKKRGMDLGSADYITKPFDPEDLVRRIKEVI